MQPLRLLLVSAIVFSLFAATSSAQTPNPQDLNVSLTSRDTRGIFVPAGSAAEMIPLLVDSQSGGGDLIDVMTSSEQMKVTLILPGGTEINEANAEAMGFEFEVIGQGTLTDSIIKSLFTNGGTHTAIELPDGSPSGAYQIRIDASASTADGVAVATYFSSSTVRAGVTTGASLYRVGETIVVSGLLFDGKSPITGANVVAAIADRGQLNAEPLQITLQDGGQFDIATGDGIYTGTFTADHAGDFELGMRATGISASGASFSRSASASLSVTPPLASFTSFENSGADDDANNLIDRIVVRANVEVQTAGRYQFALTLAASNNQEIKASEEAVLAAGAQQIAVSFPASGVLSLGINGPYLMKNAVLSLMDEERTALADQRRVIGNTAAYQLAQIEKPAIYFTGRNTDSAQDTNGNRRFDLLVVQAEIHADIAGIYGWSGYLTDANGKVIAYTTDSKSLAAGESLIAFKFDGRKISQSRINGPYSLRDVALSSSERAISAERLHETAGYDFTLFDAPPISKVLPIPTPLPRQTGNGRIAFTSDRDGNDEIYVMNADGTNQTNITHDPGQDDLPVWAPDGRKIAFVSRRSGNLRRQLYVMNGDGSNPKQLTNGSRNHLAPVWSPDGTKIVLSDGNDIWIVNIDGTGLRVLAYGNDPSWSPDGQRIAFIDRGPDANWVIAIMNADGSDEVILTDNLANNYNPVWSPDGTRIAFESDIDGNNNIYSVSINGGVWTRLSNNTSRDDSPVWSPDSTKVAFIRSEEDAGNVYAVGADGNNLTQLTDEQIYTYNYDLSWSPDSTRLIFTTEASSGKTQVNAINVNGGARVNLSANAADESAASWQPVTAIPTPTPSPTPTPTPTPSPTPTPTTTPSPTPTPTPTPSPAPALNGKIAYAAHLNNLRAIYTMNADGSNVAPLTPTASRYSTPRWSPDGTKMAFTSGDGRGQIYVMKADGSEMRQITNDPTTATRPSWSPDGNKIAFVTQRAEPFHYDSIYIMNADGSNPTLLVGDQFPAGDPAWSPDGTKIAFTAYRPGDRSGEIYVINVDGTNMRRVTNNAWGDSTPAWSLDGTRIAFTSSVGDIMDPNYDIFVINADGTNEVRLTDHPRFDGAPCWSPDGTKIAFYTDRDSAFKFAGYNIYLMNPDGSGLTNLTATGTKGVEPSWQSVFPTSAANTQPGTKVSVSLGPVTVTFMNVLAAGQTTATPITPQAAGSMPDGLMVVGNLAFEVTTTASVSGPIIVSFNAPTITNPEEFYALRVLHGENGVLVDRTILAPDQPAPDFNGRSVSARVSSLSPFLLGRVADQLSPTTSASLSQQPNAAGWHNSDATVTLTATDNNGGSGVKEISYSATGAQPMSVVTMAGVSTQLTIVNEGLTTINYFARDAAGNTETTKTLTVMLDKSAPAVSCDSSDGLWHSNDTVLRCTSGDVASGLANAPDASFSLSTNVPDAAETDRAATSSRTVCDQAGNCAPAGPIADNKVDKKAPTITINGPADKTYIINQAVPANYTCDDNGSGIASCVGPVAVGSSIDTSSLGEKSFTVIASDNAGHTTTRIVNYNVAKAGTTTNLVLDNASSIYEQRVTFTATVTSSEGTPVGSVQFFDGSATLGTVSLINGSASLSISTFDAGTHSITAAYGGTDTFHGSTSSRLLQTVQKATPTITWSNPDDSVYGTLLGSAQLNATASVPGTLTYTPAPGAVLNAGNGQTLSVSFTPIDTTNYKGATASVSINVGKAPLNVTADYKTKLLGAPNPTFTASYDGFVLGQGPGVLSGTLSFNTPATTGSSVGGYVVTPGGLTSQNYTITFTNGTLAIGYNLNLLYDPTKSHKSGSTVPIKLQLADVNGLNLSSEGVMIHAMSIMMVSSNASETPIDSGNANPDDNFRFSSMMGERGGYIFNVSTKGYPTGTYILSFTVGGDPVTHTVQFQVKH